MDSFPCNGCSLCCSKLDRVPELAFYDRGDGICIHLRDQQCSIYDDRPKLCRVDEMYETFFKKHYDRTTFYIENLKVCRSMQEEAGLPESQYVQIPKP
ncbi:hypothetical protein V2U88_25660 [Paenibacillus polymyxa]|nr:hypothetical protein [Paenibacillus polymyxa]